MDDFKKSKTAVNDTATVPLAYHELCMTRNNKALISVVIAWALSVVAIVGLFTYLWLQYDYESSVDTTGVYVITDSQGNLIASDLTPDDVIRIMEELNNGKSTSDTD